MEFANIQWLTVPEVADMVGETPSRVRRLLDDGHLVAVRRDGVVVVPSAFFRDDGPLAELRGTVTLLRDAGFDDEAIIEWCLSDEPSLGCTPVDALKAGRKAEVRRVAQALA